LASFFQIRSYQGKPNRAIPPNHPDGSCAKALK
jgi:hypothetical protein